MPMFITNTLRLEQICFSCKFYSYLLQEIVSLGEEAHLNTSFKHFVYFIQEFELIDKKELAPLQELIDRLTAGATTE